MNVSWCCSASMAFRLEILFIQCGAAIHQQKIMSASQFAFYGPQHSHRLYDVNRIDIKNKTKYAKRKVERIEAMRQQNASSEANFSLRCDFFFCRFVFLGPKGFPSFFYTAFLRIAQFCMFLVYF